MQKSFENKTGADGADKRIEKIEKIRKEREERIRKIKERKAVRLTEEIRNIKGKKEKTAEDLNKIAELIKEIERIFEPRYSRIKPFELRGKLKEKDVLFEFKAGGLVWAANFSPEGDRIVVGSGDNMARVLSLTEFEKDEKGKKTPKVLAEFEARDWINAANFSPEGDKIVVGSNDNMVRVLSLTEFEKDKEGKRIPKVLAEFKARGGVSAANFSPEGDKIVIGSGDGKVRVLG